MSARHTAWDLLPSINCPVLVMHGSDDELTAVANAVLLAKRMQHAGLFVHRGGRHGFFDEFADDIDEVLADFWTSIGV
jgi:pimeloyl-ACP methyl ester carboxylesterase